MLGMEPHKSLLPAILLIIGLAVLVGTLVSIWSNRQNPTTRRAARKSVLISLAAGFLAFAYWRMRVDEPIFPLALIAIPLFLMAPTFVIAYYSISFWSGRPDDVEDQA